MIAIFMIFAGCSSENTSGNIVAENAKDTQNNEKVFKVGVIMPLTGDAAIYGQQTQAVQELAVADVNAKWRADGKKQRIELIFEDGKCSPKDSLSSAQNLVNLKGVKVILGGGCSGETLGAAPFAEANKIIMLSPLSTSPEISNSGDYIFRNVGSDSYQAKVAAQHMQKMGYKNIAIISENTDYAQDLRKQLIKEVKKFGGKIVSDEIIDTKQKDLKTQILKIKNSGADALFINPQSPVTAKLFADHIKEADLTNIKYYGNEIMALGDTLKEDTPSGTIVFKQKINENDPEFVSLIEKTNCEIGLYCATSYDGVVLMSEMLDNCGDNTDCIKEGLYNTQNWQGKYQGLVSFDENGDIEVEFDSFVVQNGELVSN